MLNIQQHAYPTQLMSLIAAGLTSTMVVDASGEKAAYIFRAPADGTITEVLFRTASITAADVMVRVETMDESTGFPTGTLWDTDTEVAMSFSTGLTQFWRTAVLTAGATVQRGDLLAVVVSWVAGSTAVMGLNLTQRAFPYTALFTASWAKQNAPVPMVVLNYGGDYYLPVGCSSGVTSASISTSTTPDEVGNLYTPLFTQRVIGLTALADFDGACQLTVYDSANTVLATTSIAPATRQGVNGGAVELALDTVIELEAGESYRLVFTPTSTTSVNVQAWVVDAAAGLATAPGGAEFVYTSRVDAGTWSETTTQQAMIYPIIDGIEMGGGGGGRLVNGGLAG